MNEVQWPLLMEDLQASLANADAFDNLKAYYTIAHCFLSIIKRDNLTKILSPSHKNYVFFQYGENLSNAITRPLNTDLFILDPMAFMQSFEKFGNFLNDLQKKQEYIANDQAYKNYLESFEINKIIYTIQQCIGCIGDSFANSNQSRKRIGMLFEGLIKLIIKEIGLECEPRSIKVPIKDFAGHAMSYELDLVFSRNKAILTAQSPFLHEHEIVGSVKTTSKDRLDKIFLDKFLLSKLLGKDILVVAVFLHDVQRAKRGISIFGIASTFKTNHFLGYTVALNPLDGVYYVEQRPAMKTDDRLKNQIKAFQTFLIKDLWTLTER